MGKFHEIIELSLEELAAFLEGKSAQNSLEIFYGKFILAYQRGDLPALEIMISEALTLFAQEAELAQLKSAMSLRLAVRNRSVNAEVLEQGMAAYQAEGKWRGELTILLGSAYMITGDYQSAKRWFALSVERLAESGSLRKAHKARLNVLVAESHIDSKANLIPQYFDLYKKSVKPPKEDLSVASTCLLNISREYQIMGSVHAALKYCTQAAHVAEANFGSLHYYLILVHRAHLLCELERYSEALIDFECAAAAPFAEVRSALAVVENLLKGKVDAQAIKGADPKNLTATWAERIEGMSEGVKFSELENKLLEFIGERPRDKIEIVEHLYGPKLSHEVKLNRFKSLLGTLRKKSPHLVVCEAGEYRLADAIFQVRRKKSK
ncbi:MAG: hypothetical protein ACXWQJ_18420 [Bdellovibrionota bacterium]